MCQRLDERRVGDYFEIGVMCRTLGYKVDRITEINPDDTSKLKIFFFFKQKTAYEITV